MTGLTSKIYDYHESRTLDILKNPLKFHYGISQNDPANAISEIAISQLNQCASNPNPTFIPKLIEQRNSAIEKLETILHRPDRLIRHYNWNQAISFFQSIIPLNDEILKILKDKKTNNSLSPQEKQAYIQAKSFPILLRPTYESLKSYASKFGRTLEIQPAPPSITRKLSSIIYAPVNNKFVASVHNLIDAADDISEYVTDSVKYYGSDLKRTAITTFIGYSTALIAYTKLTSKLVSMVHPLAAIPISGLETIISAAPNWFIIGSSFLIARTLMKDRTIKKPSTRDIRITVPPALNFIRNSAAVTATCAAALKILSAGSAAISTIASTAASNTTIVNATIIFEGIPDIANIETNSIISALGPSVLMPTVIAVTILAGQKIPSGIYAAAKKTKPYVVLAGQKAPSTIHALATKANSYIGQIVLWAKDHKSPIGLTAAAATVVGLSALGMIGIIPTAVAVGGYGGYMLGKFGYFVP